MTIPSLNSQGVTNTLLLVIIVSSNIYFALRKDKQGTIGEAADTITVLQTDIKNKKLDNDRLREENAAIKATLTEKDHQLQMFTQVFQGRAPDQTEFMKNMTEAVKGFQEYIKANNERMEKIMQSLTILLEKLNK